MGTTLTGTKPKDTYDSLIKVTDNGPISGTAKYLSDGLGNDLPIAVSTTNVGIGTNVPASKLDVAGDARFGDGNNFNPLIQYAGSGRVAASPGYSFSGDLDTGMFNPNTGNTIAFATAATERFRITDNGVTFNGDTAAANALDDYEEGTWTPNFTLNSGTVTAHTASGSYTKIGRQVSLTLSITFTTTLLAEIDNITGMPFTAQNTAQIAIGAIRENTNTGDMWQLRINANGTSGSVRRYDNDTSIANGDTFIGTLTYFV